MDSAKPPQDRKNDDLDLNTLTGWQFGTAWSRDEAEPFSPPQHSPEQRRHTPARFGQSRQPQTETGNGKRKSSAFSRGTGAEPRSFRNFSGRNENAAVDSAGLRTFPPRKGDGQPGEGRSGFRPNRFQKNASPIGERQPFVPPTADFTVTFYPDDEAFAPVSLMMMQSRKTYEAFRLAQMILSKPERFVFVLRKTSEAAESFYFSPLAGMPFSSREEAVNYLLRSHLKDFLDVEEETVETPRGAFSIIHRCPFTKKLLGAPNYHRYRELVREHYQQEIHHLPFEEYLRRLESTREAADIQAWLDQMSHRPHYFLKTAANMNHGPTPRGTGNAEVAAETATGSVAENGADGGEHAGESLDPMPSMESVQQCTAQLPMGESAEAIATNAGEGDPSSAAGECPPAEERSEKERRQFHSLDEIRLYLLNECRDLIQEKKVLRLPGKCLEKIGDSKIRQFIQYQLHRQQKFPLETSSAMRGKIKSAGLHIYKRGRKGITYICAIPRRFRDANTAFATGLQQIIDAIEHNKTPNAAQICEILCGETRPQNDVLRDLSWLIHEGYISEMEDGTLVTYPPTPTKKEEGATKNEKSPAVEEAEETSPEKGEGDDR